MQKCSCSGMLGLLSTEHPWILCGDHEGPWCSGVNDCRWPYTPSSPFSHLPNGSVACWSPLPEQKTASSFRPSDLTEHKNRPEMNSLLLLTQCINTVKYSTLNGTNYTPTATVNRIKVHFQVSCCYYLHILYLSLIYGKIFLFNWDWGGLIPGIQWRSGEGFTQGKIFPLGVPLSLAKQPRLR